MAGEWAECKLADACSSIDYGFTASASDSEVGPRFLRITDIVSGHVDWKVVPYVAADHGAIRKYRLDDGDIVLARTGASTGASTYIKSPPVAVFASYLVRLKAKPNFDSRFLAYYLKSEMFWDFIRGVLGDKSAQPNASASTMTQAPLRAPTSKDEQRAIAHILGTLDDKIELNRRMNETLESVARALFKSWFVDFDPVRAKAEGRDPGLPPHIAALFPDRFEDSELGEIPKGWQVERLDSVVVLQRGFDLPVTRRTPGPYPVIAASGPSGTHSECMVRGPGVTTGRSGVLGRVFYVHDDFWPLNTSLWVKEFRRSKPAYAFHLLRRLDFGLFNAGSAVPTLNRNHVHNLPTLAPPAAIIDAFEEIATATLRRQRCNDVQAETLAALRDALLPKLISGEIRVKDAGRFEEALA